jgi:hypothetical protein
MRQETLGRVAATPDVVSYGGNARASIAAQSCG